MAIEMSKLAELSGTGLFVPSDFPTPEYEAVYSRLRAHDQKAEYAVAIGAMRAIAYRFVALAEYDGRFTASVKAHGPAPDPQTRYEQERDLFGFFSNGYAVFETFCFLLFAIGALTGEGNFPLATDSDERNVKWSTMKKGYEDGFPAILLTRLSQQWKTTPHLRN